LDAICKEIDKGKYELNRRAFWKSLKIAAFGGGESKHMGKKGPEAQI
jgi:hypothetical protein